MFGGMVTKSRTCQTASAPRCAWVIRGGASEPTTAIVGGVLAGESPSFVTRWHPKRAPSAIAWVCSSSEASIANTRRPGPLSARAALPAAWRSTSIVSSFEPNPVSTTLLAAHPSGEGIRQVLSGAPSAWMSPACVVKAVTRSESRPVLTTSIVSFFFASPTTRMSSAPRV